MLETLDTSKEQAEKYLNRVRTSRHGFQGPNRGFLRLIMSSNVKAFELRKKTLAQLSEQVTDLKQELASLRVQKVSSGAANKVAKIRHVRKAIARVLTVMTQQKRQEVAEQYKNKKYLPLDMRAKKTRAIRRRLTKHEASLVTERQKKKNIHFAQRKFAIKA